MSDKIIFAVGFVTFVLLFGGLAFTLIQFRGLSGPVAKAPDPVTPPPR